MLNTFMIGTMRLINILSGRFQGSSGISFVVNALNRYAMSVNFRSTALIKVGIKLTSGRRNCKLF